MTREELIAALERAEGPDEELEQEIASLDQSHDRMHDLPLPYTSSLDAALTLVPEGWGATIMTAVGVARVEQLPTFDHDRSPRWESAEAATPAIALCIAALKARA